MRAFREKLGVLGPIYRLVGEGLSDREIASRLQLRELVVHNCISWMLHSFKIRDRANGGPRFQRGANIEPRCELESGLASWSTLNSTGGVS
jgi:hypothetical protein